MEHVPTVIIEYHDLMDLWLTEKEYKGFGGFFKFCSHFGVRPCEVKKVTHCLKKSSEWPSQEWEA